MSKILILLTIALVGASAAQASEPVTVNSDEVHISTGRPESLVFITVNDQQHALRPPVQGKFSAQLWKLELDGILANAKAIGKKVKVDVDATDPNPANVTPIRIISISAENATSVTIPQDSDSEGGRHDP